MSRIALVTGGTRGIGRGCSEALAAAGYRVAANYHASEEPAKAFARDTAIPVYRWDVGDEAACAAGIAEVERDLGPIEVLVNNAGISPDRFFHKTDSAWWRGSGHCAGPPRVNWFKSITRTGPFCSPPITKARSSGVVDAGILDVIK